MAEDDTSGARPSPVVLRIKLRYEDADTMVQRFAVNVGRAGLFLPTKSLQPIGAEIKFELRLANDAAVLVGMGRVKAARAPDPSNAKAAFGMAVELLRVTPQSRGLILRMLERRKALGLAEVSLPMPEDVDSARRDAVESTGIRDSGPVIAPAPVEVAASDGLLTAPRRQSGPVGVAKTAPSRATASLAPEAPRKSRPKVSEVVERASGPIVAVAAPIVDELDEHVDVAAAIARARALAASSGTADSELDALLELASAPLAEISVEAASAELARALGGRAISRADRSAGWAPPPPVAVPAADPEPAAEPEPEAEAEAAPEPEAATAATAPVVSPRPAPAPTAPDAPIAIAPTEPIAVVRIAPVPVERPKRPETPFPEVTTEAVAALAPDTMPPEEDASLLVEAEEADEQLVTPTVGPTVLVPELPRELLTAPSGMFALPEDDEPHDTLAPPIREQLAAQTSGLMIDDDVDPGQFERDVKTSYSNPVPLSDLDEHELADDELEQMGEHTMIGGEPLPPASDEAADRLDAELAEAEAEADASMDSTLSGGDDEVVDDFEILAEADAEDADLLDPPTEAPRAAPADGPTQYRIPDNEFDYGRLDFGDEEASRASARAITPPPSMDLDRALATDSERFSRDSSSDIRPSWDTFGPPSSPYNIAPARPQPVDEGLDFDEPHASFDSTSAEDNADLMAALAAPTAAPGKAAPTKSKPQLEAPPSSPNLDLESALEELDVDFDDFSTEQPYKKAPERKPPVRHGRVEEPLPRRSSEGINIDFDDDD